METKTLAQRIKKLRTEQGLTLQQIADHMGVSKEAARKWELEPDKGGKLPRMANLQKLALFLKARVDYLMGTDPEEMPDFPYAEEARRFPEHSLERAMFIYEIPARESGLGGYSDWINSTLGTYPPGVRDYLDKRISDAELYGRAKRLLQRIESIILESKNSH